jgi:glyoxylase-like metal-dependent hydrolase (beta-lactamase superfamily II)
MLARSSVIAAHIAARFGPVAVLGDDIIAQRMMRRPQPVERGADHPDDRFRPRLIYHHVMKFECLPVTRFEQNCSILWCESTLKAAIIDPGGDIGQLRDFLEWQELSLQLVLVTHGHMDHAGGASELAAATGARIEGPHHDDADLIRSLPIQGQRFGLRAQSFVPDRWLQHGDKVTFGAESLEVLHCPGHTKGHVAYFHAPRKYAFVGDILFRHTIGAWEHSDGSLPHLVDSIRSKLFPLGDDVRFLPGHGPTSTFGEERHANPFVSDSAMTAWDRRQACASQDCRSAAIK